VSAIDLLSGPRGRRLCLRIATSSSAQAWTDMRYAAENPSNTAFVDGLIKTLDDLDLTWVATTTDERTLLGPLSESVNAARYWQPPDEEDDLLTHPAIVDALRPIADAVATAPTGVWWSSPIALAEQRHVEWLDDGRKTPPSLGGAAAKLADWKAATLLNERRSPSRRRKVSAPLSGQWWSTPALSRLPTTTRGLPDLGAVQLMLVEDGFGWEDARVTPLAARPGCRIYEITGPEAWVELVGRYPLDVSRSKRHDWWRTTGRDGTWEVPDWQAVAADFDGVHLTVSGYLCTAGRALPVEGAHTLLAGWDPDLTYWLTDALSNGGRAVDWRRDDSVWALHVSTSDTS
jgi:hypothetical protein